MSNKRAVKINLDISVRESDKRVTKNSVIELMKGLDRTVIELPNVHDVNSENYRAIKPALVEALVIACKCTSILLRRGVEDEGIATDELHILKGNYNSIGKRNIYMQDALKQARIVYSKSDNDDFELKVKDVDDNTIVSTKLYSDFHPKDIEALENLPIPSKEQAELLDDISNKDTVSKEEKTTDVTTHDGGRIRFDKEQMTAIFYKKNGEVAGRIKLAPKETWRRLIVDFFIAFAKGVWNTIRHPIQTASKIRKKFSNLFSKKDDTKPSVTKSSDTKPSDVVDNTNTASA